MKIIFEHHFKDIPQEQIPQMFDILAGNMRIIAPTGDSYEEDRRIWLSEAVPAFEHIILILDDGLLAGYSQYRLQDNTLRMDEIQFAKPYQGTGLFKRFYQYITTIIPQETQPVTWHSSRLYPDPTHPQNPYEDSMAWQPRKPMNTGEGKYLYPPLECFETKDPVISGPVDSIRFEMLREGLEDYEYFVLLKRLSPNDPNLKVPASVATSPTVYSTDPADMENHRLKLARAIEKALSAKSAKAKTDAEWRVVCDSPCSRPDLRVRLIE